MKFKLVAVGIAAGMLLCGPVRTVLARTTPAPASTAADSEDLDQNQIEKDHPYSAIFSRNIFHLVPQPPPVAPAPAEDPAAASTLKLTGLLKATGQAPRALFVNTPKAATNSIYYNLAAGERDGVLELIKINEAEESVEVVHSGIRQTILLKDNKPTTSGPTVPAAPNGRGFPGLANRGMPPQVPAPPAPVAQAAGAEAPSQFANTSAGGVLVGRGGAPPPDMVNGPVTTNTPRTQIPTRTMRGGPVPPMPPGGGAANEPAGAIAPSPMEQPIMPQEQ